MPKPKWLVIARNEYMVSTSKIRKFRSFLPILFIAFIVTYLYIIAPLIVNSYFEDVIALTISQINISQVRIILASLFLFFLMLPIQTALRQETMGQLEIYLSAPISAGDVILGEFLGQLPFFTVYISIITGLLAAVMASMGINFGQQIIIFIVFSITLFSGLWTGKIIAAVIKTILGQTAKGRDIGKALAMALAIPLVILYYAIAYGGLLQAIAEPNANILLKILLALFPGSWGSDVILYIVRNPGNLLANPQILIGLGRVIIYFIIMLWLGVKIANRVYSLEPTNITSTKVREDGAFYNTIRSICGGGHFGNIVVSVFKDYARRLENITNISYIIMILIVMNVFITPQYNAGPGEPPVPFMIALFVSPIITVMVAADVTVQGRELLFFYKKAPNAIWRLIKAMVFRSWIVLIPPLSSIVLITSPLQQGTTINEILLNTGLMIIFSAANVVFITGLFLLNPSYSDKSPTIFLNVLIALFGGLALFALSLYINTNGFKLQNPVMGMTGISLFHSGLILFLGYIFLLAGRRKLLGME